MTKREHQMGRRRWGRFLLLSVFVLLVSAGCVGARIDISWPAMGTVELNGESRVLVAYKDRIDAVDPVNGSAVRLLNNDGEVRIDSEGNPRLWRVDGNDLQGAQYFALPTPGDDDTLLFPTYSNSIVPVNVPTASVDGAALTLPGQVIAPMARSESWLYVPIRSQGIIAVDPTTADIQWQIDSTREGVGAWATPLLHEGILYVPLFDHYLHAVDAETGQDIWEPLDLEGGIVTTPLLYEDHLYVGTFSHMLYKITLDGEIVGQYEAQNWIWGTATQYEGMMYIADLSGAVHAIDPDSMEAVWSNKVAERGIRPAPVVTDEYVIVASRDGKVYWLYREDGTVAFDREVEGRPEILSDIVFIPANEEARILQDMIVVGTKNLSHLAVAYDMEGRELWVFGR